MVESSSSNLYEVDIASGNVLSTANLTMEFGGIAGFYGMDVNPLNNEVYVLVDEGSGVRSFGQLNIETGVVQFIGSVSYKFETMQFTASGQCLAMTAANDDTPSNLVEINVSNGNVTFLSDLSDSGAFSQALVYDEGSQALYRLEGGDGDGSGFYFWQLINQTSYSVASQQTMNPGLDNNFPWIVSMCYEGPGSYLVTDHQTLYSVNSSGQLSNPRTLGIPNATVIGTILAPSGDQGCMDNVACNYNEFATVDDGSCIYLPVDNPCAFCSGETNGEGVVVISGDSDNDWLCDQEEIDVWQTDPFIQDTDGDGLTDGAEVLMVFTSPTDFDTNDDDCDDLSTLIGVCGVVSDCPGDLNGDQFINTSDLLAFLAVFGEACD